MVLPFPHFLALDARAEVYSLQLSGLIKGRNSADWFDQQQHRHLNCTIESHFCSAREMSLVSRASAQMQIRLKSFRQTNQACARENTFQGNKLGLIDGPICRLFCENFFLIPARSDSLCASVSQKTEQFIHLLTNKLFLAIKYISVSSKTLLALSPKRRHYHIGIDGFL